MEPSARLAASVLLSLGLLWGCASERPERVRETPAPAAAAAAPLPPPAFVGAAVCAPCHAREHQAWTGSDHARAMAAAGPDTVLGDFDDARFVQGGVTTTFFRRAGGYFVRTDGRDGKLAEFPVSHSFGWAPLQQYLVPFEDGRLQALSIAWDSRPEADGGQRWYHLYPGETIGHDDVLHWTRLSQNWNYMCAECHSTNLARGYDAAGNRYRSSWSEINVACESCHGPGSNHVAWAQARKAGGGAGSDPGLVLRLLPADPGAFALPDGGPTALRVRPLSDQHELDTCARCHARRSTFDQDSALPFLDVARPALLEADLYHADGQILGEVYEWGSFLQSKMYRAGVRCSDCHEPHALALRRPGNAMCGTCHRPETFDTPAHHHHEPGKAGSRCVDCHMAERTYMAVDRRRDHSFRLPRPELSLKLATPNACNDCHPQRSAAWAAERAAAWFGPGKRTVRHWGEAIAAGRARSEGAVRELVAVVGDRSLPAIARATAIDLLATLGAGGSCAPALADPEPLVRWAAVRAHEGVAPAERVSALRTRLEDPVRLVRMQAARLLAGAPAASLDERALARRAAALAEFEAGERFNSSHPAGRANLALLHAERGDVAAAEAEYRAAIALEPLLPTVYVNLADLMRAAGREPEAGRVLAEGLSRVPSDPALHLALGLFEVRRGNHPAALGPLARAAELAPESPHYAYVLGVALHSLERSKEARKVLEAALRRHPGDPELLLALATLCRDRGDRDCAIAHARRWALSQPGDAAARALLVELGAPLEAGPVGGR